MIDLQSALRQYQLFPRLNSLNSSPNASSELVASNASNQMNLLVGTFNPSAVSASTAGASNYATMERARSGSLAQAQGALHCSAYSILDTQYNTLLVALCLHLK